ncbi:hypothetical protein BDR06DRAFT_1050376 [Suillus hirtellus]|nr:hypothetical protein BDR06DRAFT_1050376 [Suillus hirtellus]
MNILFNRASFKRSPRTRTRKPSDAGRPSTLQIIPECSEIYNNSRLTLSEFTLSIDDALLMLNDTPRSPTLSASSSADDSMPDTPFASDDEDLPLPTPRLTPKRVIIPPLCITKTRSIVCVDVNNPPEEDEYDFYTQIRGLHLPMLAFALCTSASPSAIYHSLTRCSTPTTNTTRTQSFLKGSPTPSSPHPTSNAHPTHSAATSHGYVSFHPCQSTHHPHSPIENRPPPRTAVPSDFEELDVLEQEEQ